MLRFVGEGSACAEGDCDGIHGVNAASWRSFAVYGRLYGSDMRAALLGSRWCCPGFGRPWRVPVWGGHCAVVWASMQRAPQSGRPNLAPGSVDPLGWSSLVRYEAVVSRPWGGAEGLGACLVENRSC